HQFSTERLQDAEVPRLVRAPTVEWTDRTAVVSWSTDELSSSRVDWVDHQGQADFIEDNELVRDHSLTLTGLRKRNSYRFQVTSMDPAGNAMIWGTLVEAAKAAPGNRAAKILQPPGGAGSFVTDNLPDTQPPVIVDGPRIREKTTQTLTVEWETDELADSFVRFGGSEALGDEVGAARDELVHQVTLTNLAPGQRYYFQVASTDPSGNGATESAVALSATAAEVDLSPPRFLVEPKVLAAADDEAVLSWRTDEAASARVEYWTLGGEVLTRRTLERVAEQRLALTNLQPDTEYLARVFVTDASQNEARAAVDLRLRTDRLPDLSPPRLVGEVVVSGVSDRGAVIEWTTDEVANSSVDYDLTPYLGEVTGDPGYTLEHRLVLTGLKPGEIYYYRVGSADLTGNGPAHSEVASFTTLSGADTEAPAAPGGLQLRAGARALRLSWQANTEKDLAGYRVYRAEGGEFSLLASSLATTSYLDEGLIEGRTYRYQVRAQDRQGNLSPASAEAEAAPVLALPAPRILGLEQGTTIGLPVLMLQAPEGAEAGLTYTAQVSTRADFGDLVDRGGNLSEGVGGLTRWRVSRTLEPAQGYWWRVRAFDGFFEGSWSQPVQLVPAEAEKASLSEDFDGDGVVGFGDFFLFADGFGGNDPILDLDGDGVVGFGDFFLFADRFGQSLPTKPRWAQQAQVAAGTGIAVEALAVSPEEVVLTLRGEGIDRLRGYGLVLEFDPPVLHYAGADTTASGERLRLVRQLGDRLLLAEHLPGRQEGLPAPQLLGAPLRFSVEQGRLPALRVRVSDGAISTDRGRGWRVARNGEARITPQAYALLPNYPNPFNPATTLRLALPAAAEGRLEICNLLGQTLRHWDLAALGPGYHAVVWDGLDGQGRPLASGVYLARLRAGSFAQTQKLLLLR
ncbi:MAG: fibronectin type III domain-containing protein, partial [Candidatus Latescibacteria bacterium]|nr:fibronectin type III domain-containing protein [Candidatus Latescibacterota bacterium]